MSSTPADLRYRKAADVTRDFIAIYEVLTGHKLTDLNEGAVLRTFFDVLAEDMEELDFAISNSFYRTSLRYATGLDLERIGEDEGVTRKGSLAASGVVHLTKASPAAVDSAVSPAGSIILSNGLTTFTNDAPCRIFAGATAWVVNDGNFANKDIPFVAQEAGVFANTGAATITQIISAPSTVDTATNPAPFNGGRTSESDEEYRQRIGLEKDRRAGGSRFAIYAQAVRNKDVYDAAVYEWMNTPSESKYVRPSPGEVWVYIYPQLPTSSTFNAGRELNLESSVSVLAPGNLVELVRNELETVRGYPVWLTVRDPYTVLVDVSAEITLHKGRRVADTVNAEAEIAQRIRQQLLSLKIGEDLSLGIVYSIINDVLPFKSAEVSFTVRRNRIQDDTRTQTGGVDADQDEIVRPLGTPSEFGSGITLVNED